MIEKNVMEILSSDDSIMYRMSCDCMSPECDLIIELEKDKDGFIFLNLYKNLEWASYYNADVWYKRLWLRITCAFRLLFTGYIRVEETFVMREPQIDGFMKALKEGKKHLE
jgi:hypothetical protein